MNNQPEIFLSHSGLDNELAISLATRIEHELIVRVFNTSDPEVRFKDFFRNAFVGALSAFWYLRRGIEAAVLVHFEVELVWLVSSKLFQWFAPSEGRRLEKCFGCGFRRVATA